MMSAILTITLNPAVDVYTSLKRIAPTHKLRCDAERRDPGGGGINVARVVTRLGGDVTAVFAAGGPIGDYLQQLVRAEGVPNSARFLRAYQKPKPASVATPNTANNAAAA